MSVQVNRIHDAVQVIVSLMQVPDISPARREQIADGLCAWEERAGKGDLTFVLPSFPYKSQNTVKKVLGHLPDAGEAHVLDTLHIIIKLLSETLQRECRLILFADGFVFYDLAEVEELKGRAYLNDVRKMIESNGYNNSLVLWEWAPEVISWSEKQALFMQRYGGNLQDTINEVLHNNFLSEKYAGLKRFISDDLNMTDKPSSSALRRISGKKAMMQLHRAEALKTSIQDLFPTSWRLSIHRKQVDLSHKLPIRLGYDSSGMWRTPWQNVPVKFSGGGMLFVKRQVAEKAAYHLEKLQSGQPWCYLAPTNLKSKIR
jgi:pyoverdine/dityrosine biosynthesis protein Dit1